MLQPTLFEQATLIEPVLRPGYGNGTIYAPQTREDLGRLIYSNGYNSPATIVMHEDPGHGWVQVPHSVIKVLGIGAKISGYSYRDSVYAYLEEDCDLSLFMRALNIEAGSVLQKLFWEVCPREYKENTPIRRKARYK